MIPKVITAIVGPKKAFAVPAAASALATRRKTDEAISSSEARPLGQKNRQSRDMFTP